MSLLRDMFSNAPELLVVLDDVNVQVVNISPNGKYEYIKLGRQRTGSEQIPKPVLVALAESLDAMGGEAIEGEWVVRLFKGAGWRHGLGNILVERTPVAVVDRLTQPVLQTLRLAIKREGNGVILGPAGASKSSILLWLASQLTEEPLLFVSENPPSELPGSHITHVFPPGSLHESRRLERLIRVYPNVMWDRASSLEDIRTLFGFGQGKRRWLSMDIATREHSSALWKAAEVSGLRHSLDLLLALSVTVIGRPETVVLGQRVEGAWTYVKGEDAAIWLGEEVIGSAPSERVETRLEEASEPPPSLEERSTGAGIRKRPGQPTSDFDNPLTIPVESIEEISSVESAGPDQQTGLIDAEHLPALSLNPIVPEVTRQYPRSYEPSDAKSEEPKEVPRLFQRDASTSSASNDLLDRIMPMLRDEPMPEVNLDDLRITMLGDVDPDDLENSRDADTRSQRVDFVDFEPEEIDFDEEQSDYSSVSEVYQDDLASILTEDDISTSVASATDYALGSWGNENFVPDPETSPTGRFTDQIPKSIIETEDREDATEEVNLSDKLRMIRERFQRKD